MIKHLKIDVKHLCFRAGVALVLLSVFLLLLWQISAYKNAKRMNEYLDILSELMPKQQSSMIESRVNNTMPSVNIDGRDFVAVMELPSYSAAFPIGTLQGKHNAYPYLYKGSIYDGSIVIGASNQRRQLDFVKNISVGDTIYVTDMTGDRFSYKVSDIKYREHADEALFDSEHELTLFVKNIYAFEYIIICCSALKA